MAFSIKPAEMDGTRWFALAAIAIVTLFMILLNTTGAWQASHNVYYTGVIAGVELLEVVCLVLILQSPTRMRKIIGSIVFAAVIYVCVENGKIAITESFKDVFKDEAGQPLHPAALRDKAAIAETDATTLSTEAPADRKAVKEELAELRVFQKKMSAMSPEGIKEAQSEMIPRCGYTGRVDGLRNVLTEAAMRKCGEQTANRILVLQAMDDAPTSTASTKSNEAVELRAKADEIDLRTVWMNLILFAVAGIQAAGLWAFVVWGVGDAKAQPKVVIDPDVFKDLQAQADELARRKANLSEGADKAVKTKTKKKKVKVAVQAIEDFRTEQAKREAAEKQKIDDVINTEYVDEEDEDEESKTPEQLAEPEPVEAEAEPEPDLEPEDELLLDDPQLEEFHAPAVIEAEADDEPANDEDEPDQKKPLQAAE